MIGFKSYCWCLGTTSFRVKDLNFKIEQQLSMLKKLWESSDTEDWKKIQTGYYNLMQAEGFVKGNAKDKKKDSREKTSGLSELGLLTLDRKITDIGEKIIDIVKSEKFEDNNIFSINRDSFVYLKQLLKYQQTNFGFNVKPMAVMIYLIEKLKYITKEEFTYIVPLCIDNEDIEDTLNKIIKLRGNKESINNIIAETMLIKDNYIEALEFLNGKYLNTLEEFSDIDMNRKSPKYSKIFYEFYKDLYKIVNKNITEDEIEIIVKFLTKLSTKNSKNAKSWKEYFNYTGREKSFEELKNNIVQAKIFKQKDIKEYNKEFFIVLHTAKWKATLEDYADLNRRYFSLTDIFLFKDGKIELDLLPKYYFTTISDKLINSKILSKEEYRQFLESDIDLENIYDFMPTDINLIIEKIKNDYPDKNINKSNVKDFIEEEKLRRFNEIISLRFNAEQLIELFKCFSKRKLDKIMEHAEWEADIPTIFEYVLAIAWYIISEKKGNILEFMKLSLNADLLPKSHATGGIADIIYNYGNCESYNKHDLLLEATLTESTSQRRNEMEPVSRHLMRHIQDTGDEKSYAVFVANFLHPEVLSDFRGRKDYQYVISDGTIKTGLKIIPISTDDIVKILEKNINYSKLFNLFDNAYNNTESNNIDWYKAQISDKIQIL